MLRVVMLLAVALSFAGLARADIPPPYEPYGIGASLGEAEPFPVIAKIAPGSPAALAGLKVGDGVIAIDGTYAKAGPPFYFFARGLQGPRNSKIEVIILRDKQQVLVRQLTRTVRIR
jgi:C-terminal processing protease CtpA/Prc